ncbi:Transmembrane and coiled-coil domain-containing protein 4 [Coemansia aciculifera]|uniref:Transmembrane and coiled-coil domain-containing protein 4 n=1 Tax=Coemansia aciculifera TaxID=417176 RepID=A0ACC1M1E0_9FUNG|nr:Transmembrane and coiled-coil domain-containing protein 4 [Coemansia aciculifera]
MAANGAAQSRAWNDQFTQSILEWLSIPDADIEDLRAMPYGDAANDMVLLMLRCKRADEAALELNKAVSGASSLDIARDPDKLYSGLVLTCLGISDQQLESLETTQAVASTSERTLRPFAYDARSRAAAFVIGDWLDMPKQFVSAYEARIAGGLERVAGKAMLGDASAKALEDEKKRKWGWQRYLAAGAGVAVAGTLVGVTAGLAAPLMAAGMGVIGIGGLGFLATAGGSAMIGSLLGIAGGGLIGKRFNTRLRGLREFYFTQLPVAVDSSSSDGGKCAHHLHATVLVPGFLSGAASASPFAPVTAVLGLDLGDAYTLYYETKELIALQGAFADFVNSTAKSTAVSLVLKQTILSGLIGAFAWPLAILKLGQLIDTPWAVGLERARRAGKMLADVLVNRAHGDRPVTLIGYSLGALTIFTCLQELHRRKAFGIVEVAVLLGMPADGTAKDAWLAACQCVSRRIVVGYSKNDWILAFLFRASSLCANLAGLTGLDAETIFHKQPLAQRKLVSLDFADIVTQHSDYMDKIDDIMLELSRHL